MTACFPSGRLETEEDFKRLAALAWCAPARCAETLSAAPEGDTDGALVTAVLSEMTSEALLETVRQICACGERLSNAAEEKAVAWLAAQYQAAGLKTRVLRLPARVSTPVSAELCVDGVRIDCITHPMTGSVAELRAKIACTTTEELERFEAERQNACPEAPKVFADCFVLLESLATDGMIARLCALGAVGIIFAGGRFAHNMICTSQWGSPTWTHCVPPHATPVVSVSAEDARKIREGLTADTTAVIATEVHTRVVDVPIIEATLEAPGAKDYILVTGHLDSWGAGALDNASGNAAALEAARILSKHAGELTHSLKFVTWSGHSHGRYAGSTAYCDAQFESLARHCLLHVNADCLGGAGASLLTLSPAMASSARLAQAALACVTGCRDWEGTRFSRSCDQSFWGAGVPSVFSQVSEQPPRDDPAARAFGKLFGSSRSGGYGIYWHTDHDTPEHLDADNLVRDARVILAAALIAATQENAGLDAAVEAMDLAASLAHRREQLLAKAGFDAPASVRSMLASLAEDLGNLVKRLADYSAAPPAGTNRAAELHALVCANYHQGDFGGHVDVAPLKGAPELSVLDRLETADDVETLVRILTEARRAFNSMRMRLAALQLPEQ